jgi:hypothetical protein
MTWAGGPGVTIVDGGAVLDSDGTGAAEVEAGGFCRGFSAGVVTALWSAGSEAAGA